MINGPKKIFVEKAGQVTQSDVTFRDNDHLLQIIDRIVSRVGRRNRRRPRRCATPACPKRRSRFNAIIPPLAARRAPW